MIIKNITKNKFITREAKQASSLMDRVFGLLISTNPRFLLLKTHFGIHTLFLKEPIDVVVLDNSAHIVTLKENLAPNSFFFYNPRFHLVLELPQNTIRDFGLEAGDLIRLD